MSKKNADHKSMVVFEVDPTECPFREFRDNELSIDFWGLGPAAFRATVIAIGNKSVTKPASDFIWVDEQTQPLPRSVRHYLHGWTRAEELAENQWGAEVVVFEENNGGKMSISDIQLSYSQVLLRSSFCRRVLSACFMLERIEGLTMEHQWENFIFSYAPEGWRAKYHIYSPGLKPGGGQQHRPVLSKNGCYLVRLFYLGAWRCVWVSDQVPVDASGAPLLPFSPLLSSTPPSKQGAKQIPATVTAPVVYLWPLLLCKALLKLAAPDLNSDEGSESMEDEALSELNVLHALTGGMTLTYDIQDPDELWKMIISEVQVFSWDDDDDTLASTVKSRSTKKPANKETSVVRRGMTSVLIKDSKNLAPYHLPGITPAHEMSLLISMARDLPLRKPLPEPEVAFWKYYRWVDWARRHGLYEAYDCPRTKFLKVNGLMKLSYCPHLLDVQSTESITVGFREEHEKTNPHVKKGGKEGVKSVVPTPSAAAQQMKEELREWIQFPPLQELVKNLTIVYYPSMFVFTSAASSPPTRVVKGALNRAVDIPAPKSSPLYLQIDGPKTNNLKISLNMLHPRVLIHAGIPIVDYIEPAYLVVEEFEWFKNCELPMAKAFVTTRGYDSVEVNFQPGRHFCRIWVHSRMNWHLMLLSESTLLLGSRDLIQAAAVLECPWASRFLSALGAAFTNWVKGGNRSYTNMTGGDKDFYTSYQPDLEWNNDIVGYDRSLLHWMFRQALQSLLMKKLQYHEFRNVCIVLRRYFYDPDFGLPPKPLPTKSLREIIATDPCDCVMPETEEMEAGEEQLEEQQVPEEKPIVDPMTMEQLLALPIPPIVSQVCELATEEIPCGVLKEEREKLIRKHEAATILQAHWRGAWARKCLTAAVTFSPEVLKSIQETAFGSLESLSSLMNEFFRMYPGAKYAYSVASALSGVYGLQQHHGSTHITPKCKWIPYFQGVFHCHAPVKVHFDVQSTISYSTISVYNNDTGEQMPQSYTAHITFDIVPNVSGYTVMGHGTLNQPSLVHTEAHWQLTVLSSIDGMFHVCDNEELCHEIPLPQSVKLHIDEMFLPNRRHILGGVQISVTRSESVSFRAAATSPDLEMVATLRTLHLDGHLQELSTCTGKGEIYWPFIRLKPMRPSELLPMKKKSNSQANLATQTWRDSGLSSARSLKVPKSAKQISAKTRSTTKIKSTPHLEPKQYVIEVAAPAGWPLTVMQWTRVDEVRNSQEIKIEVTPKKNTKDKPSSAKEKEKEKPLTVPVHIPEADDAYIEMECALAIGGGAVAKRDDERDLEFAAARRAWDANEPGRNLRGAQIRQEFQAEYLEALPPSPDESVPTMTEEAALEEFEGEEEKKELTVQQGPTPATESGMLEMTVESEEEAKYLLMPEQLKEKFIPLYFVPICMREKIEDVCALLTPDMAEAARKDRHARIDAALDRMRELQLFNELHVLGRQRNRCLLLEKLYVDAQWPQDLQEAMLEREDAIARETLIRTLSATKKKQDAKKK